eukprot:1841996-Rhodomonas_salina.4
MSALGIAKPGRGTTERKIDTETARSCLLHPCNEQVAKTLWSLLIKALAWHDAGSRQCQHRASHAARESAESGPDRRQVRKASQVFANSFSCHMMFLGEVCRELENDALSCVRSVLDMQDEGDRNWNLRVVHEVLSEPATNSQANHDSILRKYPPNQRGWKLLHDFTHLRRRERTRTREMGIQALLGAQDNNKEGSRNG